MPHLASLNHTAEEILALVANQTNPSLLMDDIVAALGQSFQVDTCFMAIAPENRLQNLITSCWQKPKTNLNFDSLDLASYWQELHQKPITQLAIFENHLNQVVTLPISSLSVVFPVKTNAVLVLIKSGSHTWLDSQKQELTEMAQAIAIATFQVALQHKNQVQVRYQSLLSRFSQGVAETSDLKRLFNLALAETGKALKVDKAKIVTLKYKDPYFIQRKRQQKIKATVTIAESWAASENANLLPKDFTFQLGNSDLFQKALQQAPEPLAISQGVIFPDLPQDLLASAQTIPDTSAVLMVPLVGKNNNDQHPQLVLGFLVLQRDSRYEWNNQEIELIQWICAQLSTALIHNQTLTQVNSIVEERTSQLQWSVDVQAKLSEKMRQQIEQLKSLNELKDDFLSSMSHELKTPMTSMKMAIKMLRQNIPDSMREKYLDILEQEWNREYNLIKDLLKLQQLESGELAFQPQELDLNQIIEDIATSFNKKWQAEKGLILEIEATDDDLKLNSDFESLNNIINELLLNAAKYSNVDSKVTIKTKEVPTFQGKQVELVVCNHGVPIEANELPYIFDKFRRGKGVTDRAVPGTGLGLTLVKHLVEHLSGTIKVTSEAVNDSELYKTAFTVTLPQQ